jgi:hypothetical protein
MAARIVIPPSGKASFGRRLKLNGRNIRDQGDARFSRSACPGRH